MLEPSAPTGCMVSLRMDSLLLGTSRPPFWITNLAGWAAAGALMVVARAGLVPIGFLIGVKAVFVAMAICVCVGLRALYRPLLKRDAPLGVVVASAVVGSMFGALVWTALYNLFLSVAAPAYLGMPYPVSNVWQLLDGNVQHTFMLLAWSALYVGIGYHTRMRVEREAESGPERAGEAGHDDATDAPATRFLVRTGPRTRVVSVDEVDWIGAEGDHVRLHGGGKSWLLRATLSDMDSRLDPRRFVRIHRSTIVRMDRIRELQPYSNREFVVVLDDGTKLRLSRSYRDRFNARFVSVR